MIVVLRAFSWFGILIAVSNGAIKVFGNDAAVLRYAGSNRSIDSNFAIFAFCLIFLALAAILSRFDDLRKAQEKGAPGSSESA